MDAYDGFVIDIYSCDRPYLVREREHRVSVGVVERETVVVKLVRVFPAPECDRFRCEFLGVYRFVSFRRVSFSPSKSKTKYQFST